MKNNFRLLHTHTYKYNLLQTTKKLLVLRLLLTNIPIFHETSYLLFQLELHLFHHRFGQIHDTKGNAVHKTEK